MDGDFSIRYELQRQGVPIGVWPDTVPAGEIHSADYRPVESLADLRLGDGPLLYFGQAGLLTDARFFSNLDRVSPPNMLIGSTKTIGRIHAMPLTSEQVEMVTLLLVRAEIINTYVHISADLGYSIKFIENEGWVVSFRGTHLYFTNDRNEDPLNFIFRIGPDGTMTVENLI